MDIEARRDTIKGSAAGPPGAAPAAPGPAVLSDDEVVTRVLAGERELFEILMRRYNQRLYRVARGILGDDAEAEDVMQDAFVRAYRHLDQFAGRALFATWLTRIAVHEALARARRRGRAVEIDAMPDIRKESIPALRSDERDPERRAIDQSLRLALETAIGELPAIYRVVLMLRDVEGLSTAATAESLGIETPAVKTRLHRARGMLRRRLTAQAGAACSKAFSFEGGRCDRVVAAVLARIAEPA
jgi:RNA polymerase sigma-70 factor (ECF subfamily)